MHFKRSFVGFSVCEILIAAAIEPLSPPCRTVQRAHRALDPLAVFGT